MALGPMTALRKIRVLVYVLERSFNGNNHFKHTVVFSHIIIIISMITSFKGLIFFKMKHFLY